MHDWSEWLALGAAVVVAPYALLLWVAGVGKFFRFLDRWIHSDQKR